jgi:hypothetical protein
MKYDLENKKVKIYTLTNPDNGEVFYVGRTTMSLYKRLNCHLFNNATWNWELQEYFANLNERNITPEIDIVDTVSYEERKTVEEYWILQFKVWGFNLLNARHLKYRSGYQKKIFTTAFRPEEVELINLLYKHGDNTIIAEKLGVSDELVRIYKNSRRCNSHVREAIVSFYEERARKISELYHQRFIKAA